MIIMSDIRAFAVDRHTVTQHNYACTLMGQTDHTMHNPYMHKRGSLYLCVILANHALEQEALQSNSKKRVSRNGKEIQI